MVFAIHQHESAIGIHVSSPSSHLPPLTSLLPPPTSLLLPPSRLSQSTGFRERVVFDTRPPVQILCPQNSAQGYTWTQGHAGMGKAHLNGDPGRGL